MEKINHTLYQNLLNYDSDTFIDSNLNTCGRIWFHIKKFLGLTSNYGKVEVAQKIHSFIQSIQPHLFSKSEAELVRLAKNIQKMKIRLCENDCTQLDNTFDSARVIIDGVLMSKVHKLPNYGDLPYSKSEIISRFFRSALL
jgi:hypothetical protein